MTEPTGVTIRLSDIGDGIGVLTWAGRADYEALAAEVDRVSRAALHGDRALRRLETGIRSNDQVARYALLSAGFRIEGVRRAAYQNPDGSFEDGVRFSRLASDDVEGPGGKTAVLNTALATKRVIAELLLRDAEGRVLLCHPRYRTKWELPGGVVERDESPLTAVLRECREELDVSPDAVRPLLVDWMPPYLGWDDALGFIFDGGVLGSDQIAGITIDTAEILSIHWVDPADVGEHCTPALALRIGRATALLDGEFTYTEAGRRR